MKFYSSSMEILNIIVNQINNLIDNMMIVIIIVFKGSNTNSLGIKYYV